MIAILADDFTGAAELGAVALRYGLSAQVQDPFQNETLTDVVVFNTDSRLLPPPQAATVVAQAAGTLRRTAEWVYKKIDSVLRGPVVAEVEAALSTLDLPRALLIPANPSLGRVIRDGHYYVQGVPLDRTDFATDKEYPAKTGNVLEILGSSEMLPVVLLKQGEMPSPRGIFVGQTESVDDLTGWAARVDARTLPVGGAEFFAAVLEAKGYKRAEPPPRPSAHEAGRLLVCGSSPPYAAKTVQQARQRGVSVLPMSAELLAETVDVRPAMQRWAQEACEALARDGSAIVSIGEGADRGGSPNVLVDCLADLVAAVLAAANVGELYVEGGATASALVKKLGWRRFRVHRELAPGVVSLRVLDGGPLLTMKPGSYAWPEEIWA